MKTTTGRFITHRPNMINMKHLCGARPFSSLFFFCQKTYLYESIASRIADFKAGAKDEECPAIGTTFNVAKGRCFRNVQALTGGQIKSFRPCRMVQGMWAIRPQSSRSCWESKKQPFLGAHALNRWSEKNVGNEARTPSGLGFPNQRWYFPTLMLVQIKYLQNSKQS